MKLGFDIDNVLVDTTRSIVHWHNRIYKTSYSREDITRFNYWEIFGLSMEDAIRNFNEMISEECNLIPPMPGSVEGMEKLKRYDKFAISSRPACIKEKTEICLEKHFGKGIKEVYLANGFGFGKGNVLTKPEIARNLGVEFVVEDSLEEARDIAKTGITVLLYDSPWNQEIPPHGVERVYSWHDVVNRIYSI